MSKKLIDINLDEIVQYMSDIKNINVDQEKLKGEIISLYVSELLYKIGKEFPLLRSTILSTYIEISTRSNLEEKWHEEELLESFIKLCKDGLVHPTNLISYFRELLESEHADAYEFFKQKGMIKTGIKEI